MSDYLNKLFFALQNYSMLLNNCHYYFYIKFKLLFSFVI